VSELLVKITEAARGDVNLLYPMKEALMAKATVGEVSDALRTVWGKYQPNEFF
jgi:methylmalonyl-CoA mutase N-terminal domain/subunit